MELFEYDYDERSTGSDQYDDLRKSIRSKEHAKELFSRMGYKMKEATEAVKAREGYLYYLENSSGKLVKRFATGKDAIEYACALATTPSQLGYRNGDQHKRDEQQKDPYENMPRIKLDVK